MRRVYYNVLIAEDDRDMAQLLGELADECGFRPQLAATGGQALAALQGGAVDLLLTDLLLPPPDGLDLLRAAQALNPDLPVVLITGNATVPVQRFRGIFPARPWCLGRRWRSATRSAASIWWTTSRTGEISRS